jgi:pyruvate dehydrogenase E2 component (dihydrolipoamide acetyltransferase)
VAVEVLMPVITDEGEDAVVTAWMVDEGSRVRTGQLIAEVQGEKVAVDVEAPADGVVSDLVAINQPVPQGTPICRIAEAGESPAPPPGPEAEKASTSPMAAAPVAASPAAKRLAREMGVEIQSVHGSGPGGRITEADVRAAAEGGGEGGDGDLVGLRAVIARNMRQSHAATAPVTLTTVADVTGRMPSEVTAWILRSVAVCLAEHPELNGVRDGDRYQAATTTAISLAIQTDAGLVAPVVKDPAARHVGQLHDEIADLAERARARRLGASDYEGGSFSVTNLGAYGIDHFTPIINLPQVAILGVGAAREVPAVRDGSVEVRRMLSLSLTFDHAFVDGAPAAAFLARVRGELEGQTG